MAERGEGPCGVSGSAGRRRRRLGALGGLVRADVGVAGLYLASALVVLGGLWMDLGRGYLTASVSDQDLWEWFFATTAHALVHAQNPLFTTLQNYPQGVNLMANTTLLGLSVPLAPLTLLAGPTVTWAVVLTLGLAGTSFAWYRLFSRHLVTYRAAAAVGGGFAGFAPPVISHANAHPNFVIGFVFPAVVLVVVRIADGVCPIRNGVVLGLLITCQVFLGEELLLIGAVAAAFVGVVWMWDHTEWTARMVRPLARGLGTGGVVALVLLAVPLWWQFAGPQSYWGLPHSPAGNPLDAFTTFATQSLAGEPEAAAKLSLNRTEENAFFGWPLVVLLIAIIVVWRRDVWMRALGIAALALGVLSLGATLLIGRTNTGIPIPWGFLQHIPLVGTVLTSRFALGMVPLVAALLALATDRAFAASGTGGSTGEFPLRGLWVGVLVAALLPIAPLPLPVGARAEVPAFFTNGTWRSFVDPGGTVVPVPLADPGETEPLHWQVASGMAWSMPGGYFVGPDGGGRRGRYGAPPSATSELLGDIAQNKRTVVIDDKVRALVLADLRAWHADVLVLVPDPRAGTVRRAVDDLVGPRSQVVDGVVIWDVRDLTGQASGPGTSGTPIPRSAAPLGAAVP